MVNSRKTVCFPKLCAVPHFSFFLCQIDPNMGKKTTQVVRRSKATISDGNDDQGVVRTIETTEE